MFVNFLILGLTAFISVNGQLLEVPTDSDIYAQYVNESVTDIGNPDNVSVLPDLYEDVLAPTSEPVDQSSAVSSPEPTVEPTVLIVDNEEEIALLAAAVELLAENSDTATGALNSTVLSLMDRMVDSYPDYYRYAGFRTDDDDSYASTLYISKSASVAGNTITFGSDCVAIVFSRYTTNNGYSGYVYYNVYDSPGASVDVNNRSIVYTNCLDGYPALGTRVSFPEHYFWILIFVILAVVVFIRRNS